VNCWYINLFVTTSQRYSLITRTNFGDYKLRSNSPAKRIFALRKTRLSLRVASRACSLPFQRPDGKQTSGFLANSLVTCPELQIQIFCGVPTTWTSESLYSTTPLVSLLLWYAIATSQSPSLVPSLNPKFPQILCELESLFAFLFDY